MIKTLICKVKQVILKNDLLAVLSTGYGKSLLLQVLYRLVAEAKGLSPHFSKYDL